MADFCKTLNSLPSAHWSSTDQCGINLSFEVVTWGLGSHNAPYAQSSISKINFKKRF